MKTTARAKLAAAEALFATIERDAVRTLLTSVFTSSTRGASSDALAKLYGMFGINPADPDASYKLSDMICALRESSKAESAAEAVNNARSARPRADEPKTDADKTQEAQEVVAATWNKAVAAMREIMGLESSDPAVILEAVNAASEKLKLGLNGPPDLSAYSQRAAVDRAVTGVLRAENDQLRTENAQLRDNLRELESFRESNRRHEAGLAVDADARARSRGLNTRSRDALIAAKLQSDVNYRAMWEILSAPYMGDVMGASGATRGDARAGARGGTLPTSATATTAREAIQARAEELRAKGDTDLGHIRVAKATRELRDERPELFE